MSQCWMYSKHWESITQNFSSCKQSFITKIHQYSHEYYINIFDVVNDIFVCFQSNHVLDWVTNRVTNVCQLSDGVSLDKTCYTIVIICLQNNLILISPAEAKLIKDTRQHQIMDDSMMKVLLTGGDRSLLWHTQIFVIRLGTRTAYNNHQPLSSHQSQSRSCFQLLIVMT